MATNKTFKIATWCLLALNIVLMAALFFGRPKGHDKGIAFNFKAMEILALDDAQKEQFQVLAEKHQESISRIRAEQRSLLTPYFEANMRGDSSEVDLLSLIQDLEKQKLESTSSHLAEVKSILREDQLLGYETFVKEALKVIVMQAPNKGGPRKEKK